MIKGFVVKNTGKSFNVLVNNEVVNCYARGKVQQQMSKVLAGDQVLLDKIGDGYVITEILKRKNQLIRPYISNLDQLVIIMASVPTPDYLLVDKLLIGCKIHGITPIIAINKSDINTKEFNQNIINEYSGAVKNIVLVSAVTGQGVEELEKLLSNKLSAFAGRSATGKTTLLNTITGMNRKTDGVSKKINAGKNTTRDTEIFVLKNNTLIADTPGFNMLNYEEFEPVHLREYYEDFEEYNFECKFLNCVHIKQNASNCAVTKAVQEGLINKNRYDRYSELYLKMKEGWESRYD